MIFVLLGLFKFIDGEFDCDYFDDLFVIFNGCGIKIFLFVGGGFKSEIVVGFFFQCLGEIGLVVEILFNKGKFFFVVVGCQGQIGDIYQVYI